MGSAAECGHANSSVNRADNFDLIFSGELHCPGYNIMNLIELAVKALQYSHLHG